VGYHDGDERGQGVHVPVDAAAHVGLVAVEQAVAVGHHARVGPRHVRYGRSSRATVTFRLVLSSVAGHVRAHRVFRVHHVSL